MSLLCRVVEVEFVGGMFRKVGNSLFEFTNSRQSVSQYSVMSRGRLRAALEWPVIFYLSDRIYIVKFTAHPVVHAGIRAATFCHTDVIRGYRLSKLSCRLRFVRRTSVEVRLSLLSTPVIVHTGSTYGLKYRGISGDLPLAVSLSPLHHVRRHYSFVRRSYGKPR